MRREIAAFGPGPCWLWSVLVLLLLVPSTSAKEPEAPQPSPKGKPSRKAEAKDGRAYFEKLCFEPDKATLRPAQDSRLARVCEYLKKNGELKACIIHRATPAEQDKDSLSQRRATLTKTLLISCGIDANRIEIEGRLPRDAGDEDAKSCVELTVRDP